MILMSHRIAQVARRHQVRGVVVGDVEVEMIDVETAGHRPSPIDPLLTPVASVRAVPDSVEQNEPVLRDQPAGPGQHMFRDVHGAPTTAVGHDVPDTPGFPYLPQGEVAVPFDPGVMPAAHPLRKVRFGASGDSAKPCFRPRLLQAEGVTGLLPSGVVLGAEPESDDAGGAPVDYALVGAGREFPFFCCTRVACSSPTAVMHRAQSPGSRCPLAPVDYAFLVHTTQCSTSCSLA